MSFWLDTHTHRTAPAVIGHRGAPDLAIENTARSFELAMSAGADILETDVRLTADGHIVCFHDDDFLRLRGRHERVDAVSLSDARAVFPDLLEFDDFLALTGDCSIVVDVKFAGRHEIDRFVGAVESRGALGRSLFTSYTPTIASLIRERSPQAGIGIFSLDGVDQIASARAVGARWIRVLPKDYEPSVMDGFRDEGLSTIAVASPLAKLGSPADRTAFEQLAELGMNAVITGKLELAVEVFKGTRPRRGAVEDRSTSYRANS
ncbi:glycerophosphodiester phosphodiesterase [Streptomyces sp. NPDC004752]